MVKNQFLGNAENWFGVWFVTWSDSESFSRWAFIGTYIRCERENPSKWIDRQTYLLYLERRMLYWIRQRKRLIQGIIQPRRNIRFWVNCISRLSLYNDCKHNGHINVDKEILYWKNHGCFPKVWRSFLEKTHVPILQNVPEQKWPDLPSQSPEEKSYWWLAWKLWVKRIRSWSLREFSGYDILKRKHSHSWSRVGKRRSSNDVHLQKRWVQSWSQE